MTEKAKTGCGCLSGGCLAAVIVLVLALGAVGACGFFIYQKAREYTSAEAGIIQVSNATPEQIREVHDRVEVFRKAVESNGEAELELSGDDINTIIAGDPKWQEMKGKVFMRIVDGLLYVDASVPLTEVAGFSDRFLNGTVGFEVSVENGKPNLYPKSIDLNGKQLPKEIEQSAAEGFSNGFLEELETNPDAQDFFSRVRSLKIDGDKMRIHIVPAESLHSSGAPSSAPTSDPTVESQPDSGATAEQNPRTYLCQVQVMAYDRNSQPLGFFQAGTTLEIVGPCAEVPGMIEVRYNDPQKGLINAICKAEDLGMAPPSSQLQVSPTTNAVSTP